MMYEIQLRDLERKIDSREASSKVITENGLNKINTPTYDGQTSWTGYQLQFDAAGNANGWSN